MPSQRHHHHPGGHSRRSAGKRDGVLNRSSRSSSKRDDLNKRSRSSDNKRDDLNRSSRRSSGKRDDDLHRNSRSSSKRDDVNKSSRSSAKRERSSKEHHHHHHSPKRDHRERSDPTKSSHHHRHESPQRRDSSSGRSPPKRDHHQSSHHHSSQSAFSPNAQQHMIIFSPTRSQFAPGSSASLLLSTNNEKPKVRRIEPNRRRSSTLNQSPKLPTIPDEDQLRDPLPIPTYEGNNTNNTIDLKISPSSQEASKEQERRRVDEAFLLYTYAEKAAIQIQRNFRNKKAARRIAAVVIDKKEEKMNDFKEETAEDIIERHRREEEEKRIQKEQEEERSKRWTLCFIAIGSLCILSTSFISCFASIYRKCCKKSNNNNSSSDVDALDAPITVDGAVNPGATTGGGPGPTGPGPTGGVGGGAAPPPGLEAMAGQAAASASSAASSGVAAGTASAGAAASASAAAAGAAAGAVTAQTVTAVAISSAVAATAATATLVVTSLGNTPPPTSICGLVNPDVRMGQFTMIFEGFARPFDDREKLIVENLVIEAYNNLTIGSNLASVGCLDPLSREMTEAKLVNQTWADPIAEGYNPLLETVFETTLLCDKCASFRPLFSQETEQERQEAERRLLEHRVLLEQEGNLTLNATEALNNRTDAISGSDLLSSANMFEFTSREFFQRMLQLVIFKTEDLSDEGELPEGFVQMTKAFVTPVIPEDSDGEGDSEIPPESFEDYLVTEIAYQPGRGGGSGGGGSGGGGSSVGGRGGGSTGAFRFTYVNEETGREQTDVVLVDVETLLADPMAEPVPTTLFPTFAPTRSPTQGPSTVPTTTFSGQPTREPFSKPSMAPSFVPGIVQTEPPSLGPLDTPSNVPSVVPTERPSMVPSIPPSNAPTGEPTITGSIGPTKTPSIAPSMVPSVFPSESPSRNPSSAPSMVPSKVPSVAPSGNPSSSPSSNPSSNPSSKPSSNPSATPSDSPSSAPSSAPTIATYHYVVCGSANNCAAPKLLNSNSVTVVNTGDPYNSIGVRCCADSVADASKWNKKAGCPYAESNIPLCHQAVNWYDAVALCAGFGGRLCTRKEMETDLCAADSGCGHNARLNWVSNAGVPP